METSRISGGKAGVSSHGSREVLEKQGSRWFSARRADHHRGHHRTARGYLGSLSRELSAGGQVEGESRDRGGLVESGPAAGYSEQSERVRRYRRRRHALSPR